MARYRINELLSRQETAKLNWVYAAPAVAYHRQQQQQHNVWRNLNGIDIYHA